MMPTIYGKIGEGEVFLVCN